MKDVLSPQNVLAALFVLVKGVMSSPSMMVVLLFFFFFLMKEVLNPQQVWFLALKNVLAVRFGLMKDIDTFLRARNSFL